MGYGHPVPSLPAGAKRRWNDLRGTLRLSLEIADAAWLRRRPFLLYYKPTARCDCRCQICDRWERQNPSHEELSLAAVEESLGSFRRAGAVVLTLWGGEPLLRQDLPEILQAAKRLGYRTSLCTNARRLPEQADRIAPLLDVLLCSLDGYGEVHDELRGVQGLFDRVLRGIEAAKRHPSCDVKIWTAVHRKNRAEIARLCALAQELAVGIELFPLAPIGGHNDDLSLGAAERSETFGLVQRLKQQGYPIRNPDRALDIMRHGRPFRCNFPTIAVSFDHRGVVHTCEDPRGMPLRSWGAEWRTKPEALYRRGDYRAATQQLRTCNCCTLPCITELSGALPRALADMLLSRAT